MEEHLPALRSAWPSNYLGPHVFSCQANSRDKMAALHANLLVFDGANALISSANFSHHGLHENIEIGVKVTSSSVARLVDFFNSLIIAKHVKPLD
jgi:phosphatidylserine/phosphatidylglycerophosphate/cardiolipin synthase-like enzyme